MARKLVFYSQLDVPVDPGQQMDPVSMVQRAGYVPLAQRVQELIDSGQQLQAYREGFYDTEDYDPPIVEVGNPNEYDHLDVFRYRGYLDRLEKEALNLSTAEPEESTEDVPKTDGKQDVPG